MPGIFCFESKKNSPDGLFLEAVCYAKIIWKIPAPQMAPIIGATTGTQA